MVAQNTVRTYGVNLVIRFVEGIWLHRKSRQLRFFFRKGPILLYKCATFTERPFYINTIITDVYSVFFSMFVFYGYLIDPHLPFLRAISEAANPESQATFRKLSPTYFMNLFKVEESPSYTSPELRFVGSWRSKYCSLLVRIQGRM